MENEKITFESIYEILREEKKREELTQLEKNYFLNVSKYLIELSSNILPDDELSQKQLLNVKRMITEIFERREAKIVRLAMLSSRIKSNFIDKSKLLPYEFEMFENLSRSLKEYREKNLDFVLKAKDDKTRVEKQIDTIQNDIPINEIKNEGTKEEAKDLKITRNSTDLGEDKIRVSFTKEISKFVGENMEIFGPFAKDEVATLPKKIANILASRQNAVILSDEDLITENN